MDAVKSSNEIFNRTGAFRVSPNEGDLQALCESGPGGTFIRRDYTEFTR